MNAMAHAGLGCGVFLLGLTATLLGRRGRRIDDHPLCRNCGYDLTGRPETSERCAECGADLKGWRAIRVGNGLPSRGMLRVGVMAMLLGLAGLGWSGYRIAVTINWMHYRPLSWLADDLDGADPVSSPKARDEILRRMQADLLSSGNEAWLVDHFLARHENAGWPMPGVWAEVLIQSIGRDRVSAEQIDRYLAQVKARMSAALSSALQVPPRLKRGEPLRLVMNESAVNFSPLYDAIFLNARSKRFPPGDAGRKTSTPFWRPATMPAQLTLEEIHLAGTRVAVLPRTQGDLGLGMLVRLEWDRVKHLPDGVHQLEIPIHLEWMVERRMTMEVRVTQGVNIVSEQANPRSGIAAPLLLQSFVNEPAPQT